MAGFPLGMILLLIVAVLIYFGLAHRVLDRMRMSDGAALVIIGLMIIGSFIEIPIPIVTNIESTVNLGGFIIPVAVAIYVFAKAGTRKEVIRTLFAIAATALVVYFFNTIILGGPAGDPWHSGRDFIDPMYLYPIVAGTTAYIVGRSRRGAFIAAVFGVLILDLSNFVFLFRTETRGTVALGGAGVFDIVVLAGIFAVLLAEAVGETLERIQGGPQTKGRPRELIVGLQDIKDTASAKKPVSGRIGVKGGIKDE